MRNAIEFLVIRDLYKEVEVKNQETGETILEVELVKKDLVSPWLCRDTEAISDFEPAYSDTGRRYANRTVVTYNSTSRVVKMPYNELKKKLNDIETESRIVGYGTINHQKPPARAKS